MTVSDDIAPPRARQRWFKCIEYEHGFRIELPIETEQAAIEAGIEHVHAKLSGIAKVGYYGFRARVIVYGEAELRQFADRCC